MRKSRTLAAATRRQSSSFSTTSSTAAQRAGLQPRRRRRWCRNPGWVALYRGGPDMEWSGISRFATAGARTSSTRGASLARPNRASRPARRRRQSARSRTLAAPYSRDGLYSGSSAWRLRGAGALTAKPPHDPPHRGHLWRPRRHDRLGGRLPRAVFSRTSRRHRGGRGGATSNARLGRGPAAFCRSYRGVSARGLINGALNPRRFGGGPPSRSAAPLPFRARGRPAVSALVSRAVTGLFDKSRADREKAPGREAVRPTGRQAVLPCPGYFRAG